MSPSIEIANEYLESARLTPEQAKTELAVRLYRQNRLTLEQAKQLSGADGASLIAALWEEEKQFNLNDFLSWASHDLKTPLNAIIGFSKVVLKGIDGPVNEMQVTDLTSVHNGGKRMLTVLSNLVEIARLNNAEVNLNPDTVEDFGVFVGEAVARWKNENPGREVAVEASLLSPSIRIDPRRMRQVITSLLTYASFYVEEGLISLNAQDDAKGVNITIQSHGKKPRDKSEMDAAMLGFIARSVIELHGGKLEMLQEMDEGAMILFSLPR